MMTDVLSGLFVLYHVLSLLRLLRCWSQISCDTLRFCSKTHLCDSQNSRISGNESLPALLGLLSINGSPLPSRVVLPAHIPEWPWPWPWLGLRRLPRDCPHASPFSDRPVLPHPDRTMCCRLSLHGFLSVRVSQKPLATQQGVWRPGPNPAWCLLTLGEAQPQYHIQLFISSCEW